MRTLLCIALAGLAACGESTFIAKPLGELVLAGPLARSTSVRALLLPPSESLIWEVRAGGMTIGRAELDIGDADTHSRFSTSSLASMFTSIHHELVTTLDRAAARPNAATETVVEGGETTRSEVAFDGNGYTLDGAARVALPDGNAAHTIHSALGWMRAWAAPTAAPSYLYVLEDRQLFRIDLERPIQEDLRGVDTLRIDGRIHTADATIAITIWLTADGDRRPVRIAIVAARLHLTAELVS